MHRHSIEHPVRTLTGVALAAALIGLTAPSAVADSDGPLDEDDSREEQPDRDRDDEDQDDEQDDDRSPDRDREDEEDRDDEEDEEEDEEDRDNGDEQDDSPTDPDAEEEYGAPDSELVLALDASGSMNETDSDGTPRIEAARDALHDVVDGLDDDLAVGFRVFSNEISDPDHADACEDSELVVPVEGGNRADLREAIDAYDAVGGRTPLAYALEEAAEDLGDEGQRTIILVSDGEENCVPDPCEVAETISSQGIDLNIHTVGYNVEEEARDQLQCIAEAGDGEYFDAEDTETLKRTLERLSDRAFQPFTLVGEEVEGGANWGDAPELAPGAQYIDEFAEEKLHYRIPREMQNSSMHVAVTTHNSEGEADWVDAELQTWDGDRCDSDSMVGTEFSTRDFLRTAQLTAFRDLDNDAGDDPCAEDDELVLAVEFNGDDVDTVGQPFEITIHEEPAAADQSSLVEAIERSDIAWTDMGRDAQGAEDIVGGSSFNYAPRLDPGDTYDGEIIPGEALVFRVPVEWGETLQAEAFYAEPGDELSDNLSGSGISSGLSIMSPMRGIVDSEFSSIWGSMATELQAQTPEVRWNNRGGQNQIEYASVAGEHYVVLVADHHDDGKSFPIPYRLTVQTFGEAGQGEPDYAEDGTPAPEPGPREDEGRDEDEDREDRDEEERDRDGEEDRDRDDEQDA